MNLNVQITRVDITVPVMLDTDSWMTTRAAKVKNQYYLIHPSMEYELCYNVTVYY